MKQAITCDLLLYAGQEVGKILALVAVAWLQGRESCHVKKSPFKTCPQDVNKSHITLAFVAIYMSYIA